MNILGLLTPLNLILLLIVVVYTFVLLRLRKRLMKEQSLKQIKSKQVHSFKGQETQAGHYHSPANDIEYQRIRIDQLSAQLDDAKRQSKTLQKFIPKQFVDHFGKGSLATLELGRADEDNVSILFCDIRGFTGLSEKMSPHELINFLNSYFMRMNAPIHSNGGFIDKFIGDGIMALFDHPDGNDKHKAVDSINAALDMRKEVYLYNMHRKNSGYSPINIGIGIHFGNIIFGTVGSHDRMDTTVVGDNVNVASRLESLASRYDADIIVSSQVLDASEAKKRFAYRLLDWVRVPGRQQPVEIYEIIDHQPQEIQAIKLSTAKLLKSGLQCRIEQNWDEAIDYFKQAIKISPNDKVLDQHIEQCYLMRSTPKASDWDGALDIHK